MTAAHTKPRVRGFEPPLRRVLAVDAGTRCIRLLLLESYFGRLRILRQDAFDLHQEGLVAPEEMQAHLQKILAQWGRPPLALVLPQQVAVSENLALPQVPEAEARKLIEAETVKIAGVGETALIHDFVRVGPPLGGRQNYWVTFCQEGEIQSRITQLGLDREDFRDITTTANALLTAWQFSPACQRNAAIVHLGAQSTTVVVMREGAGVFAVSFPMAGDFFTRAIARLRSCSNEAAEAIKHSTNLFTGKDALPGFAESVDGWVAELKRQLAERDTPGQQAPLEFIATGDAFEQPGFQDYLATKTGLKFQPWPLDESPEALPPAMGFEIALGAGLQALGCGTQPISLVPANRRTVWRRRLGRQRLEFANAVVLGLGLVALVFGIWQKVSLINRKQALITKVKAGIETVQANTALTTDLLNTYDNLRPVFERQQNTVDTLQAIPLLQQARSNRTVWCVLLADQQSYFSFPPTLVPTNKLAAAVPTAEGETGLRTRESTNASPARPGLIAELCIPDTAEGARITLGQVVASLKKSPGFARVDLLSEDLRRSLADPKVLVRDRHFALALDFATAEFTVKRAKPATAAKPAFRTVFGPRPAGEEPEKTNPAL